MKWFALIQNKGLFICHSNNLLSSELLKSVARQIIKYSHLIQQGICISLSPFPENTKANWFKQPIASYFWDDLHPCSLEYNLWTSSGITWEVTRNAEFQASPRTCWLRISVLTKFPRLVGALKFENNCSKQHVTKINSQYPCMQYHCMKISFFSEMQNSLSHSISGKV